VSWSFNTDSLELSAMIAAVKPATLTDISKCSPKRFGEVIMIVTRPLSQHEWHNKAKYLARTCCRDPTAIEITSPVDVPGIFRPKDECFKNTSTDVIKQRKLGIITRRELSLQCGRNYKWINASRSHKVRIWFPGSKCPQMGWSNNAQVPCYWLFDYTFLTTEYQVPIFFTD
jgi:hypothetical protein